ncbi:hypothetical protein [Mucilaginibacter sp.]|jgi:hypothetical protein|uniref:hypothetical protein n=1 Tax=Mucilaginibacter sp. TaxID=1882438 RepID=UPI003564D4C8
MKKFISKNIQTIALVLLMLMSFVSCRRSNTTTIVTSDGSTSQKIEYVGRIVFSQDQTRIENIAKGGYVKFTRDDRSVEAEPGWNGKIAYRFNGDSKVDVLTDDQKQFLSYAIKTIIKERAKLRAVNKN